MLRKFALMLFALVVSLGVVGPVYAHNNNQDAHNYVYLMTNATNGNQVPVYHRANDGSLTSLGAMGGLPVVSGYQGIAVY